MTIKECYQAFGGDYEDILGRFMTEERVKKFALKFLNDKSFDNLGQMIAEKNYDEAFRAAHTLKGICQNLSMDKLFRSSNEITEDLRNGKYDNLEQLYNNVKEDYCITVEALKKL